ncbi:hypothetical protein O181_051922 [Austropuccinia psidii MF-1]|uniref:Uncharacterized protein n=1 Tax=Austropuccinia psidii MF-1 TaxID=1389203 RepID=A0A9Q3E6L7_9BASI|nr:hypothetical protein [Austropuccinia psidii MF-1]
MSFNFTPLASSLKFKKNSPPFYHADDFMVRTKPNIEHQEDNYSQTNHDRKLTQRQRKNINDSKQIMSHLGHLNRAYKDFSNLSIDKKSANSSWSKLPSVNTLPHPYVIIDKTEKPALPVILHEITPFDNSSGHAQILKYLIMKLMTLSHNGQEIKTNTQVLGRIMKFIGFCQGSYSGKSSGV